MKKFKDLKKNLQEVSLDKFLKDKKVRKGIRRKSSWDLRDRQFGIEIELEPEQFGFQDMISTEIDHDTARLEWENSHEKDSQRPQEPSDWIDDRVRKIKSYSRDQDNDVLLSLWKEIDAWWTKNWLQYEDDDITKKWNSSFESWNEYITQQLFRHLSKSKKNEKQWGTIVRKKTEYKQSIQKIIDHPQKWFPFFEEMHKNQIISLKKATADIRKNVKSKFEEYKEILDWEEDPESIWEDLNEFDNVVDEWIEWLESGEQTAFEEWLDYNIDIFISEEEVDIDTAVDEAESSMQNFLKLDWEFVPDGTPAVELKTDPLNSKDLGNLYKDLSFLSKYDTDSNLSAHIHIEKGMNFDEFEKMATIMLTDEEELTQDEYLGEGRESNLEAWAKKMHKRLYDVESFGESTDAKSIITALTGGYNGIVLSKSSTRGKTIEFRYPSSTLLDEYHKILANIQYFMAVVSLSKRKTVVRKILKRGPLFNRVAYLVRDPSTSSGCRYQIIDVVKKGKMQKYIDMSEYPQDKGIPEDYVTFDPAMKNALKKYGSLPAKMVRELRDVEENTKSLQTLIIQKDIKMHDDDTNQEIKDRRITIRKNVKTMLKKQRRAR